MQGTEINVQTGKITVLELSPEEEAEILARRPPVPLKSETVADLKAALIAKGVLTQADLDAVK